MLNFKLREHKCGNYYVVEKEGRGIGELLQTNGEWMYYPDEQSDGLTLPELEQLTKFVQVLTPVVVSE